MKKLLLLFIISILFLACATFDSAKVSYIENNYNSGKGYFEVYGRYFGVDIIFRTLRGTDKVYIIVVDDSDDVARVSSGEKVLLKFTDEKEISLNYDNKVSQHDDDFVYSSITATSSVIDEFGTLDMIIIPTSDGAISFECSPEEAQYLINNFNMIKAEAQFKYGESL